ncbi:hypothetical protein DL93DRAFT_2080105 [Clavulina sp. PMI_390]|nr:hypothetical protein DL93DRAFT_2080105 [Clavulina sp. PMI_390]
MQEKGEMGPRACVKATEAQLGAHPLPNKKRFSSSASLPFLLTIFYLLSLPPSLPPVQYIFLC